MTKVTTFNSPFDSRMLQIGSPENSPLRRGWIRTDDNPITKSFTDTSSGGDFSFTAGGIASGLLNGSSTIETSGVTGRINFLYNPSQVAVSHSANLNMPSQESVAYAQSIGLSAGEGTTPLSQMGTMSLSLLFDRTYELWDRKKYANTRVGKWGVYDDVIAFYRLFGMLGTHDTAVESLLNTLLGDNHFAASALNLFPSFPLGYPVIYVYLGARGMKFHGAVQGFNVTYTHWSRNMIPVRAEVDLTLMLTPDPALSNPNRGVGGATPSTSIGGSKTTYNSNTHTFTGNPPGAGLGSSVPSGRPAPKGAPPNAVTSPGSRSIR